MQGGMKKNWMAYPRAVINRLPAKSILLFIQNQRGGTVSPHPTIPITRPRTAATPPNTSVNGDGFSKRYRPPRINVIGLIYWNIQRNMKISVIGPNNQEIASKTFVLGKTDTRYQQSVQFSIYYDQVVTVSVSKTSGSDPVLSWISILKDS